MQDQQFNRGVSRRCFLLGIAAFSITAAIPTIISCSAIPVHDIHNQLSDDDFSTLMEVQEHLFPRGQNSPGANDIRAAEYFTWVLSDTGRKPEELLQMREGIWWVKKKALSLHNKEFTDLSTEEKETVLRDLANEAQGEKWLSSTITLIFEALLSDPIYGSNFEEQGWKWLEHQPGVPRPTNKNRYNPKHK